MPSRACSGLEAEQPADWVVSSLWGFGVSSLGGFVDGGGLCTVGGTKSKGDGKEKGLWCSCEGVDRLIKRARSLLSGSKIPFFPIFTLNPSKLNFFISMSLDFVVLSARSEILIQSLGCRFNSLFLSLALLFFSVLWASKTRLQIAKLTMFDTLVHEWWRFAIF